MARDNGRPGRAAVVHGGQAPTQRVRTMFTSFPDLFRARSRGRGRRPAGRARRPQLEALEDRTVPSVWFVNDDAAGRNSGRSWADAYTDLQSALAAAVPGDEIWVAGGTYKPTATTARALSFRSGDGGLGAPDPNVWVQGSATPAGPSSGWALAHPFAVVPDPAWTSANINALWISPTLSAWGPQAGYEYFVDFVLPQEVEAVSVSLKWRADDLSTPTFNGQLFTPQ